MKPRALFASLLAAALLAAPAARAQSNAEKQEVTAQAKSYFDAGLQAYEAAQYVAAADAFLKAHELVPSPSLTFSAAQAYRRQFFIDKSPEHLREALRLYRDYLARAEQGRRREDASEALRELAPFELRYAEEPKKPQRERPTQLLITSRTPGAQTSIDGGPPRKVPLVARVSPGEHTVVVRAAGYFEETSKTIAIPRETISVNALLRPMPVELHVRGDNGAKVYVDGALVARVPSAGPVMLSGGDHSVAVMRPGHVPYSTPLSLGSGSRVDIDVSLPPTVQRYAALVTLGTSGAGVAVTGLLAGLAASAHAEARDIDTQRQANQINGEQRDAYNDALARRDQMIIGATVAGGATAAMAMLGLGLFVFDNPDVDVVGAGSRTGTRPAPAPDTELLLDASGVSIRGTF